MVAKEPLLASVKAPKCFFSRSDHEGATLQLHHFCDASEGGYGTALYLRIAYPDGLIEGLIHTLFILRRSCMICFTGKITGPARFSGSKTEQIVDKTPLIVLLFPPLDDLETKHV